MGSSYDEIDNEGASFKGDQIVLVESWDMLVSDGPWKDLQPLFDKTVYVNTSSHIASITAATEYSDVSTIVFEEVFDLIDRNVPRSLIESKTMNEVTLS